MADPERLLGVEELAEYLDVPIRTIYVWGQVGEGPPRMRLGKRIKYRRSDVERWLESKTERPRARRV